MMRTGLRMRSGAYASSRQDTDYAGQGGGQELRSPVHDGRYGLPDMDVSTRRFKGHYIWSGRRVLETTFFAQRDP
jgi:hypothetical protein